MLAIGRALMARPRLIMFDEPSLGLAPTVIETTFRIIGEIQKDGTTVFMVEQNAYMALRMATRAYVMETGRITLERPGARAARRRARQEGLPGRLDRIMGAKYFGASVLRREDPRLLRGEGRFVDDIKLPGLLHAAFVRSPHAHARITGLRTEAAAARPGVVRVLTFADLERWMKPLPLFGAIPAGLAARVQVSMKQVGQLAMCRDTARYVGEIVAMVVADSRALAEDAAELVEVDYEPRRRWSPTWWRPARRARP